MSEIRFTLNSLLLYSCCKSMPFCLENYIPLFKEFISYLQFIKRRLENTRVLQPEIPEKQKPKTLSKPQIKIPQPIVHRFPFETEKPLKSRRRRGMGANSRSKRNHYLVQKAKKEEKKNRVMFPFTKQLTQKQKDILRELEEKIEQEEDRSVKLLDISVITQVKIMLTILRNLLNSGFNEKVIINEKTLMNMLYHLLLRNNDGEIDKLTMEIFSVLSRYLFE